MDACEMRDSLDERVRMQKNGMASKFIVIVAPHKKIIAKTWGALTLN